MKKNYTDRIIRLADEINAKRRQEIIDVYNNKELFDYLRTVKDQEIYRKGSKSKVWRKIASIPHEVDIFFTRIYGDDYYKEKDFFTRHHPEWAVIHERHI